MDAVGLRIPDLGGKAVLVTGASTGIGAALAIAYARQGSRVALHYNASKVSAEEVAKAIRADGGEVFLVQGDFSVSADVTRVVEQSAQHFGRLDAEFLGSPQVDLGMRFTVGHVFRSERGLEPVEQVQAPSEDFVEVFAF